MRQRVGWSPLLISVLPAGAEIAPPGEPALAAIVLTAWASLLGSLVTEIFGSLTALIGDTDTLYQAHVRTVTLGMGFQPALTEPSAPGEG